MDERTQAKFDMVESTIQGIREIHEGGGRPPEEVVLRLLQEGIKRGQVERILEMVSVGLKDKHGFDKEAAAKLLLRIANDPNLNLEDLRELGLADDEMMTEEQRKEDCGDCEEFPCPIVTIEDRIREKFGMPGDENHPDKKDDEGGGGIPSGL